MASQDWLIQDICSLIWPNDFYKEHSPYLERETLYFHSLFSSFYVIFNGSFSCHSLTSFSSSRYLCDFPQDSLETPVTTAEVMGACAWGKLTATKARRTHDDSGKYFVASDFGIFEIFGIFGICHIMIRYQWYQWYHHHINDILLNHQSSSIIFSHDFKNDWSQKVDESMTMALFFIRFPQFFHHPMAMAPWQKTKALDLLQQLRDQGLQGLQASEPWMIWHGPALSIF